MYYSIRVIATIHFGCALAGLALILARFIHAIRRFPGSAITLKREVAAHRLHAAVQFLVFQQRLIQPFQMLASETGVTMPRISCSRARKFGAVPLSRPLPAKPTRC
jgi:hypothetical protein